MNCVNIKCAKMKIVVKLNKIASLIKKNSMIYQLCHKRGHISLKQGNSENVFSHIEDYEPDIFSVSSDYIFPQGNGAIGL